MKIPNFEGLKSAFTNALKGLNTIATHILADDLENASKQLKATLLNNDKT